MPRAEKPIDMSRGPVAELAVELRALRDQAGTPPYRELAARAGYSPAVLSQAAAGRVLPSWPVVRAFVAACGGDLQHWERRWHDVERAHAHSVTVEPSASPQREDPVTDPVAGTIGSYGHAESVLRVLTELSSPGDHLGPDAVTAYVAVELSPAARHRAAVHLVDCQQCVVKIAAARESQTADRRGAGTIPIFVMDDHEIVRRSLRQLLEAEPDMEIVGEAATAAEALAMIPVLRPRVTILDVRLADGNGVTVCRNIRSAIDPPPACLMLTSYSDDAALFGAIMAGASGYLLKQTSGNDVVGAVRKVAAGGSLLDAEVTRAVFDRLRGERTEDPRYAALTAQERKILDLIALGLTNRQIGHQLYLAEKTVKNYVSTLLVKLGFDRRTEAAVYATKLRAERRMPGAGDPPDGLSPRELEVLQLMADGHSDNEIARRLKVSTLTVRGYFSRIGRKLGAAGRTEMAVMAMRAGMIR